MTDEELMRGVCQGDQKAYQILVSRHLKPISHYAFRLLGNSRDTEDITQETFLRMWINAARWQPDKATLSTWLHRITHNLCIDFLRKHGQVELQASFEEESRESGQQDSGTVLDDADRNRRIQDAIMALPENQRSALMLCHYQGFSNKEAAAIMDISVKALESAIARARRTLRKNLEGLLNTDNLPLEQTGHDSV